MVARNNWGRYVTLLGIPVAIYIMNRWAPNWDWPLSLSPGNQLKTWELVFVFLGFFIDDVGTSIGLQADEYLTDGGYKFNEGNPYMVDTWNFLMENKLAKTETAAHRLIYCYFTFIILMCHFNGWLSKGARFHLLFTAVIKAYAGYGWWGLKPNDFTISDFFTFKDGKPTPWRQSQEALSLMNTYLINRETGEKNLFKNMVLLSKRRRLTQEIQPVRGLAWYQKFGYVVFPV